MSLLSWLQISLRVDLSLCKVYYRVTSSLSTVCDISPTEFLPVQLISDYKTMIGAARPGLALALLLVSLQGVLCQDLHFDSGIQHGYPSSGGTNWTAAGKVRLAASDLIIFDPRVTVQTVSNVCSINLRSCLSRGQSPATSTTCYCTQVSGEDFDLFVSSQDDPPQTELAVQATVPSRYLFSPLSMTAKIGSLPSAAKEEVTPSVCCSGVKEFEKTLNTTMTDIKAEIVKVDDVKSEIVALKSMVGGLSKESKKVDEVKTEIVALKSMVEGLSKESKKVDGVKTEMAFLKSMIVETSERVADIDNRLESQNKIVKSLTYVIATQNSLFTELTEEIKRVSEMANNNTKTIDALPKTCNDVSSVKPRPVVTLDSGIEVVCDTRTDLGGWIIFQRRAAGNIDFFRVWDDYRNGFGDLEGDFWLGLEAVHKLTSLEKYELRIDLTFKGKKYFAKYKNFAIQGEYDKYTMNVSGYIGNAGDSLTEHSGYKFSTKDMDNSPNSGDCATKFRGGWWYFNGCHNSNLNGEWGSTVYGTGVIWQATTTYGASASFTEMKIRPLQH